MSQQAGAKPPHHGARHGKPSHERSHSLKPVVLWVGGILTTVISAVAVGAATGYTSHLFGGKTASALAGPPLAVVSVSVQRDDTYQGGTYIFPSALQINDTLLRRINSVSPGLSEDNYYESWARTHGGIDPGAIVIQLILAGNRTYPVRILNMQPVGQCTAPLNGTLMLSPPAGEDNSVLIGFNLDKSDPVAQSYSETQGFGQSFFESRTVTLAYPQQQVFEVFGRALQHYCQFKIRMTLLVGRQQEVEVIGDGSQPFRVSGVLPYVYYKEVYFGGVMNNGCPGVPPDGFARINAVEYSHLKNAVLARCSSYLYRK